MTRKFSEIGQHMKEIENSIQIRAYAMMRQLSLSVKTFEKNYELFKQHLESINNMDYWFELSDSRRSPMKWEYHASDQETYRQLLNFVASAQALVEHTRSLVEELYLETDFQKEYQDKVNKELKDHPTRKFVQELRNYVLHSKFPFVGAQFSHNRLSSIGDQENLFATSVKLTLNKEELLESDRWTAPSKLFLASQDELIFLDVLADEYYSLINDFQMWLNKRQKEMHESEYTSLLENWKNLYQELQKAIEMQQFD
jgi:hypothetical protein